MTKRFLRVFAVLSLVAGCGGGGATARLDDGGGPSGAGRLPPPPVEPADPDDDLPSAGGPAAGVDLTTVPAWSERFAGAEFQYGYSQKLKLAVDHEGNVFVAGDFKGALNFGGGRLASAGEGDIVVAKFDPEGHHLWSKRFGDQQDQIFSGLAVDAKGNVLITGVFNGTVDFGAGPLTAGYLDMFLVKLDTDGDALWSKRFGGDGTIQWASAVAADEDGDVFLTGSQEGLIDYGGLSLETSGAFTFLVKFTADGQPRWGKALGGSVDQHAIGIAVDPDGNVVLGGHAKSVIVDGVSYVGKGMTDIFVAKWSGNGDLHWAGLYGDPGDQWLSDISLDPAGDVILGGTFQGQIDFPGAPLHTDAPNSYEFFVAKLDPLGQGEFSKAFPTGGALAVDGGGNIVIAGGFEGTLSFGAQEVTSAGSHDIFMTRLKSTGETVDTFRAGDRRDQRAISVAVDRAGRVILLGLFDGKLNLGSGTLTGARVPDLFLAKMPR